MNCTEVKDLLSNYYDAELSPDARERVAAHLDNCLECSAELARFGQLSGLMPQLPLTLPSQLGWRQFQMQLVGETSVEVAERISRSERSLRRSWGNFRDLRTAMSVAALLLVTVGWFMIDTWFGHAGHNLLAADMQQYVEEFQHNPQAAQQALLTKYEGRTVGLNEAVRLVSYEPAAAGGLPAAYTVDSMHLLRMPCCDCLQTVCQRGDGSKFVIFEYGEEHPASAAHRPDRMAHCGGENCCLVQINEQFAMSWKKGERHISVVGVRDLAEMEQLSTWFN